jgi:hypothetical protein
MLAYQSTCILLLIGHMYPPPHMTHAFMLAYQSTYMHHKHMRIYIHTCVSTNTGTYIENETQRGSDWVDDRIKA